MARIIGFKKLEIVFRRTAGIDLDKSKADKILDIIEKKFHDLLLVATEKALFNGRKEIMEIDMPITKGFMESLNQFNKLQEEISIADILDYLKQIPPLDLPLEREFEEKLPEFLGALLLVFAQVLKEIGATRKPSVEAIEKVSRILDLTL